MTYLDTVEFAVVMPPSEYRYDDGSSENSLGLTAGGDICWIHRFDVVPGGGTITSVSTAFGCVPYGGSPPNGTPFQVYVWNDPDNDGNPDDAVLVASGSGTISGGNTDLMNVVSVTPTAVSGQFFVGVVCTQSAGQFPAPMDETTAYSVGDAWICGCSTPGGFNPYNLTDPSNDIGLLEMSAIGWPAYFLLRAGY